MFLSTKEKVFFILTFTVLFFFSKSALFMGPNLKIGNTLVLVISSLLGSLLLMLVYKYGKVPHCQADGFHFQVTPAKLCEGFPYMQTSDPQLYDYCANLLSTKEGVQKFENTNCTTPGFIGRPVGFRYTPESNDKWENERCVPTQAGYEDPQVL